MHADPQPAARPARSRSVSRCHATPALDDVPHASPCDSSNRFRSATSPAGARSASTQPAEAAARRDAGGRHRGAVGARGALHDHGRAGLELAHLAGVADRHLRARARGHLDDVCRRVLHVDVGAVDELDGADGRAAGAAESAGTLRRRMRPMPRTPRMRRKRPTPRRRNCEMRLARRSTTSSTTAVATGRRARRRGNRRRARSRRAARA